MFDAKKHVPAYIQIAEALHQDITNSVLKVGEKLPSENTLAKQFGVAPETMRKAMQTLVTEGFLYRKQGLGTFVATANFDTSLFRFFHYEKDGKQLSPVASILRKDTAVASHEIAQKLNITAGSPIIFIERIRKIDNQPVQFENIYLPYDDFKFLLDKDPDEFNNLLYPMYEQEAGKCVATADESIQVVKSTKTTANHLNINDGDPVIELQRVAKNHAGEPIEWRRCFGNTTHFKYSVTIK